MGEHMPTRGGVDQSIPSMRSESAPIVKETDETDSTISVVSCGSEESSWEDILDKDGDSGHYR
jgi:hypothetical protein